MFQGTVYQKISASGDFAPPPLRSPEIMIWVDTFPLCSRLMTGRLGSDHLVTARTWRNPQARELQTILLKFRDSPSHKGKNLSQKSQDKKFQLRLKCHFFHLCSNNQCPFPIIKYRSYFYSDKSKNCKLNLADSQGKNINTEYYNFIKIKCSIRV